MPRQDLPQGRAGRPGPSVLRCGWDREIQAKVRCRKHHARHRPWASHTGCAAAIPCFNQACDRTSLGRAHRPPCRSPSVADRSPARTHPARPRWAPAPCGCESHPGTGSAGRSRLWRPCGACPIARKISAGFASAAMSSQSRPAIG
jgi:hypothetical protein